MLTYHIDGTLPADGEIFVFGSNRSGRHGAGAALVAKQKYGAISGVGRGRMGMSYGIQTKDSSLRTIALDIITLEIQEFLKYASGRTTDRFFVTAIGCGLAGYSDKEIAPLFRGSPDNCSYPENWKIYLEPLLTTD